MIRRKLIGLKRIGIKLKQLRRAVLYLQYLLMASQAAVEL